MTATTGFKVISRFDPAIDGKAMSPEAVYEFRQTGDVQKLVLIEGVKPTTYHCRRLRITEMQAARSAGTTDEDLYIACFARGLMRADNVLREDGTSFDWTRPDADRPITMREIEQSFDAGEAIEVGAAIYGRSILGKGRPAAWPLPATSRLAVEGLVAHRVAETLKQAANSVQSKSDPEAPSDATSAG